MSWGEIPAYQAGNLQLNEMLGHNMGCSSASLTPGQDSLMGQDLSPQSDGGAADRIMGYKIRCSGPAPQGKVLGHWAGCSPASLAPAPLGRMLGHISGCIPCSGVGLRAGRLLGYGTGRSLCPSSGVECSGAGWGSCPHALLGWDARAWGCFPTSWTELIGCWVSSGCPLVQPGAPCAELVVPPRAVRRVLVRGLHLCHQLHPQLPGSHGEPLRGLLQLRLRRLGQSQPPP